MNIKNHGDWARYTPSRLPKEAPAGAMFAQRVGDAVDWYDYVNSGDNFAEDSVKLTVTDGVVSAAVTDPTMLFPQNATVLEVFDVHVGDPQKAFGMKVYNISNKSFDDPPKVVQPDPLAEILKRLEALEKKKGPD